MERVGDIMERLGFNKEADDGIKAAFVKNLIKQAYGVEVSLPPQYETQRQPQTLEEYSPRLVEAALAGKPLPHGREKVEPQQLSFDLENTAPKVG